MRALVRYTSTGDTGNLARDALAKIEVVHGNLESAETVREAVAGCDVVFNLAALVGIPYSYVHPAEVLMSNSLGTLNVLEACRREGVSRLVQTSTSEVYGTARYAPIDEAHPKQPQSPYSASKIGADALALSFHMSYELPVAVIRPFNTYGPRQSQRAVIPTIIAQALATDEVKLGSLAPTRDFTFVLDLVDAFVRVAEVDAAVGREINVGSGKEITIGELAREIIALVGRDVKLVQDSARTRPEASEVQRLLADASLAREILGWTPTTPIREGLARTIDWMREAGDLSTAGDYKV